MDEYIDILVKLWHTDILYESKIHLTRLMAQTIDLLNDDDMNSSKLDLIFDNKYLVQKYYPCYRNNIKIINMYMFNGYIHRKFENTNDNLVKLLVLENYYECFYDYASFISKEELFKLIEETKKIINNI